MDSRKDWFWKSDSYNEWILRPGALLQCHSDGGMREKGVAAAACTLTATELGGNGILCRTLMRAAAVFIHDEAITPPGAERIALTMAFREMACFTQRLDPYSVNSLCV